MDESWFFPRLLDGLLSPFFYLVSPGKRLFLGHLLMATLLAYWVYRRGQQRRSFLSYILHPKIWLGDSARIDYALAFINGLMKALILGPWVFAGFAIAFEVSEGLHHSLGRVEDPPSLGLALGLYTLAMVLVGDLCSYLVHYAMHRVPFLWAIHQTHHSATHLNPVTQYRIHPIELLINNGRSILVFGVVTGCFDYWVQHRIEALSFLGVNILRFGFLAWGSNLRHSHVELRYWPWLERILISPHQHQIHHDSSQANQTKNLGAIFAIWDLLFGTLRSSTEVAKITFGLAPDHPAQTSLWRNLWPQKPSDDP
tara:strand:- start:2119 stop:3054 length:936 start_codon:yes stop_codon:yes gene_type:complete